MVRGKDAQYDRLDQIEDVMFATERTFALVARPLIDAKYHRGATQREKALLDKYEALSDAMIEFRKEIHATCEAREQIYIRERAEADLAATGDGHVMEATL